MQLIITAESSLKDIQQAFSLLYPFLKIEFQTKTPRLKWSKKTTISMDKKVNTLIHPASPLIIPLFDDLTVSGLEQLLAELLDLSVQVFRRAGTNWIETMHTQHWTLEQQNQEGSDFSEPGTNLF